MAREAQDRRSGRPKGQQIGYARVSTDEQATEAQEMELRSAGCDGPDGKEVIVALCDRLPGLSLPDLINVLDNPRRLQIA